MTVPGLAKVSGAGAWPRYVGIIDSGSETPLVVLLFGGGLLIWVLVLVPTIIAFRRHHPDRWLITGTNLLLGATGMGWLAALAWALRLELPNSAGPGVLGLQNARQRAP